MSDPITVPKPGRVLDARSHGNSPLYLLERFDVGVVHLNRDLTVTAMNSYARRTLPVDEMQPFEKMVLSFHPERSVAKVKFLLDQAECPVSNPPPMTMIINIPERVLLIKVTKLSDLRGDTAGYTLIFYDITELVSQTTLDDAPGVAGIAKPAAKRQLHKIPTVSQNRTVLVDVTSVTHIRSEGHYTWVSTAEGSSFCNLTIGDLAERLEGASFLRIHRSYLANLDFAEQILRDEGKVSLKLRGENTPLPVARTSVARLMEELGITEIDAART
jgi:DNA-binding LytR/AlgR family response regulator